MQEKKKKESRPSDKINSLCFHPGWKSRKVFQVKKMEQNVSRARVCVYVCVYVSNI